MSADTGKGSRALNALAGFLGLLLITSMALLVVVVLWGIFARFILGQPSSWSEPMATYLLMWVSLLGAALVYRENGHLGVDYFVGKLDPGAQRVASLAVELLVIFFAVYALAYGGYSLVSRTLAANETVPGLGMKMGHVYLAIPISGAFFILFGIEHIVQWFRAPAQSTAAHERPHNTGDA